MLSARASLMRFCALVFALVFGGLSVVFGQELPVTDNLARRLETGLELIRSGIDLKDDKAQIKGFELALRPFFDPSVIIDRPARVEAMTAQLESFLVTHGNQLSPAVIEAYRDLVSKSLERLKVEGPDYEKTGWTNSILAGFAFSTVTHLLDRTMLRRSHFLFIPMPGQKIIKNSIRHMGAWIESKGQACRFFVAGIALKSLGRGMQSQYRLTQHLLAAPAFAVPIHFAYVSRYENWDMTERALEGTILPMLDSLEARAERLDPRR